MQFQGRELRVGDKLVSKRHGSIEVNSLHRNRFTAVCEDTHQTFEWEYTGRYAYVDEEDIDATWPTDQPTGLRYEDLVVSTSEMPPFTVPTGRIFRDGVECWTMRDKLAADLYKSLVCETSGGADAFSQTTLAPEIRWAALADEALRAADVFLEGLRKREGK